MTNTMKLKNKKGFTLTELIVVIVIIGILAAVLIPSLTGYITRARESAAQQEASAFVTVYNAYILEEEAGTLKENETLGGYAVRMEALDTNYSSNLTKVNAGFTYITKDSKYTVTYTAATGSYKVEAKTSNN